jgi:hypothetical protein
MVHPETFQNSKLYVSRFFSETWILRNNLKSEPFYNLVCWSAVQCKQEGTTMNYGGHQFGQWAGPSWVMVVLSIWDNYGLLPAPGAAARGLGLHIPEGDGFFAVLRSAYASIATKVKQKNTRR